MAVDQLISGKEKLENFMFHYGNCLNALEEVKELMVQGKDITEELGQISHFVKEAHEEI